MAEEGGAAEVLLPPAPPLGGTDEEQTAAIKMQAVQRGRIARAAVDRLRAEGAAVEDIAEKEVESAMFEGTPEEQAAAVTVQAMQRGRAARAQVARLREAGAGAEKVAEAVAEEEAAAAVEGTAEEQAAATKLQAVQRGRMARSEVARMKEGTQVAEEAAESPAEAPVEVETPELVPTAAKVPAEQEAPADVGATAEEVAKVTPEPESDFPAAFATDEAPALAEQAPPQAPEETTSVAHEEAHVPAHEEAPSVQALEGGEGAMTFEGTDEVNTEKVVTTASTEAELDVTADDIKAAAAAVKFTGTNEEPLAAAAEFTGTNEESAAAAAEFTGTDEESAAAAAEFTGTDEESAAALKIQSLHRGKAARTKVEALRAERDVMLAEGAADALNHEAASAAEFAGTEDENSAALKIQAMQRGKAARAEVATLKAQAAARAADLGIAEVEANVKRTPKEPPLPKSASKPQPQPRVGDIILEALTPMRQWPSGSVSYAATGFSSVPGFPLAEVKRSFHEAAMRGGEGIRAMRLELAAAVLNNTVLAAMMDQPARARARTPGESDDGPGVDTETLGAIVAQLRGVEGTSDEDIAIGIEAFFSYFGAGLDEVEALSTAVFDLRGDELIARGEDELIQQLNRELVRDHDSDAKVVLIGGTGAQEGKRSVYRFWPDIVTRSETGDTGATARDIFEEEVGAQYTLGDMSVLDVASLHWSKPRAVGEPPPERVGHAAAIVPMRIHAAPSPSTTGVGAELHGRYGYGGSVQLSSLVAHCAGIAREGASNDGTGGVTGDGGGSDNDIFAQHSLGKVLANTLMHCWASSVPGRGRGVCDGLIPASHVAELVRLLDGGRAVPPESEAEEGLEAGGGDPGSKGEGEAARLFREMLEELDSKHPPRAEDGARDPLLLRRALLSSAALLYKLPQILRDAEKRTTGTPEHLVIAADSLVLTSGAPPGTRCVWVDVRCATPMDPDLLPHEKKNGKAGAEAGDTKDSVAQTEVHGELSFRTPYFFPGANGGWAAEGKDPQAPEKPGQTRCNFAWETSVNVGYAGCNAAAMRTSLVRMVEHQLRHSLSFTVYAAADGGGTVDGNGDVPELEEVKLGELRVDLVDITKSGRDVSHEWLPVLAPTSGVRVGWIKVTVYAQRALRTMLFATRRAYLDAFKVVVFGGRAASLSTKQDAGTNLRGLSPVADMTVYNAATNAWGAFQDSRLTPKPRWGHSMVASRASVVLFGGTDGAVVFDDVYVLDTGSMTWRRLNTGVEPAGAEPRHGHTMDVVENLGGDRQGSLAVVIGGESDGGKIVRTVQLMDVSPLTRLGGSSEPRWLPPLVAGRGDGTSESSSPALLGHATAAVREGAGVFSVYLFGGRERLVGGKTGISGELWRLQVKLPADSEDGDDMVSTWEPERATAEWSQPAVMGGGKTPPAREGARLLAVGRMLVLMHGWAGTAQTPWLRDCWIFDTRKVSWISVAFADHYPSARYGHTASLVDFRQAIPSLATLTMPEGRPLPMVDDAPKVKLRAGVECMLQLTARDSRGSVAARAGDNYHCVLRPRRRRVDPDGFEQPLGLVAHPSVSDTGDGSYAISFTPLVVGPHELWVLTERGEHVVGSPMHAEVEAGRTAVDCCIVAGAGLRESQSGDTCAFVITARDACGNLCPAQIEDYAVSMQGPPVIALGGLNAPCEVSIAAVPGQEENIRCTYEAQFAGFYTLAVRHGKSHITGSPFTVRVVPSTFVPAQCTAYGRGLRKQWFAGREAAFVVTARDRYGNRLTTGGERVVFQYATLVGSLDERTMDDGTVTDNGDGTYTCTYTPADVGPCRVYLGLVQLDPATGDSVVVPIGDSPLTLDLSSSLMSPAHCTASGPGTGTVAGLVQADTLTRFIIEARDRVGNPLGSGGDQFKVAVRGPRNVAETCTVTDMDDGSYLASYTPRRSGRYTIEVTGRPNPEWTGEDAPEQAFQRVGPAGEAGIFHLLIRAGPTAARCSTVAGDAVFGGSVSREATSFTITASDESGNRRGEGGDSWDVTVRAAWDVPVAVADNGDGTYTCAFTAGLEPEFQGCTVYMVSVMLCGEHVVGSPFAHKVTPLRSDASRTSVVGFAPLVTAMEPCEFLVQVRDEAGRDCLQGMDDMAVAFEGTAGTRDDFASVLMDIKDLKNGSYLVRMVSERKSFFRIRMRITMNGADIRDSPLDVTVVPSGLFNVGFWGQSETLLMDERTASEEFVLHGPGLETATAGEHADFDILSRRMGEHTPGDAFRVELRGPQFVEGLVGPAEGPREGGLYTAQYCCTQAGLYVGTVKLGRWVISGHPFQLEVHPDRTSAAHCHVEGPGLAQGQAGLESTFVITSYDMHGNLCANGEDVFRVVMKGGGRMGRTKRFRAVEVTAAVLDQRDGTYVVSYTPPLEGNFLVSVTHTTGGHEASQLDTFSPVRDSPFACVVRAGDKKPRTPVPAGNEPERAAMRRHDGAVAAALLAQQAAQKSAPGFGGGLVVPAGGRLPPLNEDAAAAATSAKPLFGLRKMLAAKKDAPKPAHAPSPNKGVSAAMAVSAERKSVDTKKGVGFLAALGLGEVAGTSGGTGPGQGIAGGGKLFSMGFWGGAEVVIRNDEDTESVVSEAVSYASEAPFVR